MLSFFGIHRAVRTLLSPAERHRPWRLYLIPGLLLLIILEHAWDTLLIPVLIKLITRHIPEARFTYEITLRTLARISLALFHSAIFGPLEVIKVRLAAQRYEQSVGAPRWPARFRRYWRHYRQRGAFGSSYIKSSQVCRPVLLDFVVALTLKFYFPGRLRTDFEQPAYTSLFNCVRSITSEEGFETFYCAWWYTLLVALIKVGIIRG
ncbi:hypothetical protein J3R83DRAFT_5726 [Lanmaoa asiatica]|nr:hypothetical protein J3R83DRAFT_5726 [Lanmaoa asiatica]